MWRLKLQYCNVATLGKSFICLLYFSDTKTLPGTGSLASAIKLLSTSFCGPVKVMTTLCRPVLRCSYTKTIVWTRNCSNYLKVKGEKSLPVYYYKLQSNKPRIYNTLIYAKGESK